MEIKKGKTGLDEQMIEFKDQSASDLRMWVEEHSKQGKGTKILYFDTDTDYFKFSQEQIKALLPYLQAFAETGSLSPLQGERKLDKHIAELEELVRDWRSLFEVVSNSTLEELQEKTS